MRFQKNLAILKLLKSGIDLKDYSGFGGLHKIISKEDHDALKNVLGDAVYKQIMASSKTAYYTPTKMIELIYTGLKKLGFTGGKILEPACGHGAFIFNCPDSIKEKSVFHAIELDRISARLTRLICPYAKVANLSFENTKFNDGSFDVVLGNPPYSSQKITCQDTELDQLVIHHYFVAKSIKLLKDNGILAFVVPSYCLDNIKGHARNIMAKYGSLIAAFRLPENMFDNAKVTVDIIFFSKNHNHYCNYLDVRYININNHQLAINKYFIDYPEHVIGNLETCNMYNERIGLTVRNHQPKDIIYQTLDKLMQKLPTVINNAIEKPVHNDIENAKIKIAQSINALNSASSELETKLNHLSIERLKILEQELLRIEQRKHTILEMINS
ncbi:N-6 DNA methylase [Facilibium subflavum]|uniref:N-6 DNA methylase n=1 Tax=Facilibium subflavum TaxID=2219058 RepID=UPI000E654F36|nr:N-6 DNA methylase [Facilibium subflavum]